MERVIFFGEFYLLYFDNLHVLACADAENEISTELFPRASLRGMQPFEPPNDQNDSAPVRNLYV